MPIYNVIESLRHNGERLESGDTVELTVKEAKPLLDGGVIAVPAKQDKNTGKGE